MTVHMIVLIRIAWKTDAQHFVLVVFLCPSLRWIHSEASRTNMSLDVLIDIDLVNSMYTLNVYTPLNRSLFSLAVAHTNSIIPSHIDFFKRTAYYGI